MQTTLMRKLGFFVLPAALLVGAAMTTEQVNFRFPGTGGTLRKLTVRLSEVASLGDFLPDNYVTDCSVDYTTPFNNAIAAAQTSTRTRTLKLPKGCFKVTANLTAANISIVGEGGAAFNNAVAGTHTTEIDCYAAGACLTFNNGNEGGRRLEGIRFVSKAAGQTGVIIQSALGTITNLAFREFDTAGLQMGIASVVGAYYSDVSNVVVNNQTTQGAVGVLVSGGFPSTNANRFRNVVVSGRFTHLWEINGTKNIVMGGDADPDTRGTGVAAVWYITGSLNDVRGSYSELVTGSSPPASVATFTSTTNSNTVADLQVQYGLSTTLPNQSVAYVDLGWNNRVDVRPVGFNLLTVASNSSDQNLVVNSGFTQWDAAAGAPYGWTNIGGTGTAAQDTATTLGTITSLKLTGAGTSVIWGTFFASPTAGDKSLNQYPIGYFRGKQVTCSVWAKSSFANEGNLRVTTDGTGGGSIGQTFHSGSGNWERLTASNLVPTDATKVGMHLRNTNTGGVLTGDIWFSQPTCVVGTYVGHYAGHPLTDTTAQMTGPLIEAPPQVLTYSATMATDWSTGNWFVVTATNTTAFTFSAPTNLKKGQCATYTVKNTAGAALGAITWTGFKTAGFTAAPATTKNRSVRFCYDGTNAIETFQSAADVPN